MTRNHLPQDWTLTPVALGEGAPVKLQGLTIPATVPGCVHTDLLAAGAITDPYADGGEAAQAWIGHSDWLYRCAFTAPADLRDSACIDLVCEGLDTVARIELNGTLVAETEDMHIVYRFPVKALLRPGENNLAITFTSPIRYAQKMLERLGHLNYSFPHNPPHNFIRKAACHFGWDWGPSLPGAGIWRPIRLEGWNTARIEAVRPLVRRADAEQAEVEVLVDVATASGATVATVKVRLLAPDGAVVAEGTTGTAGRPQSVVLIVSKPQLWWPAGHGDQPLYTLEVVLADSAGRTLDTWRKRTGLKTSRIVSEKDTYGQSFALEVNSRLVFAKGYNWIPDDCFPSRVNTARYRRRILQAREGGANILRVWGGGLFETDEFYDACDELGLMVWQDFLFACSAYPEEPPFAALIEQEARTNLARLARHPSLVILNGGNENIWIQYHQHHVLGDGKRGWGLAYYLDLLPRVCSELLPTVPYWPNSTLALRGRGSTRAPACRCSAIPAPSRIPPARPVHPVRCTRRAAADNTNRKRLRLPQGDRSPARRGSLWSRPEMRKRYACQRRHEWPSSPCPCSAVPPQGSRRCRPFQPPHVNRRHDQCAQMRRTHRADRRPSPRYARDARTAVVLPMPASVAPVVTVTPLAKKCALQQKGSLCDTHGNPPKVPPCEPRAEYGAGRVA